MVKQLKNRYNDPGANKRFVMGIDRARMKLYDCEQEAQNDIMDSGQQKDTPAFDKTTFGSSLGKNKDYEKFTDIKV